MKELKVLFEMPLVVDGAVVDGFVVADYVGVGDVCKSNIDVLKEVLPYAKSGAEANAVLDTMMACKVLECGGTLSVWDMWRVQKAYDIAFNGSNSYLASVWQIAQEILEG